MKGRISLWRWLILLGVAIALAYWKQRRRAGTTRPAEQQQSAASPFNVADEELGASEAEVAQLGQLAQALRAAVGQFRDQLRKLRQAIPSALSEAPARDSQAT